MKLPDASVLPQHANPRATDRLQQPTLLLHLPMRFLADVPIKLEQQRRERTSLPAVHRASRRLEHDQQEVNQRSGNESSWKNKPFHEGLTRADHPRDYGAEASEDEGQVAQRPRIHTPRC
jgi:hypothetical protein